jgi:hypothetical protein
MTFTEWETKLYKTSDDVRWGSDLSYDGVTFDGVDKSRTAALNDLYTVDELRHLSAEQVKKTFELAVLFASRMRSYDDFSWGQVGDFTQELFEFQGVSFD